MSVCILSVTEMYVWTLSTLAEVENLTFNYIHINIINHLNNKFKLDITSYVV